MTVHRRGRFAPPLSVLPTSGAARVTSKSDHLYPIAIATAMPAEIVEDDDVIQHSRRVPVRVSKFEMISRRAKALWNRRFDRPIVVWQLLSSAERPTAMGKARRLLSDPL
jgi:hypothetical protein